MQAALGGPIETEKRRNGMYWLGVSLKPEWQSGGKHAAA
jgi:hypothetical protein